MKTCFMGIHNWEDWDEYSINKHRRIKDKYHFRYCKNCTKKQFELLPPLDERIKRGENKHWLIKCYGPVKYKLAIRKIITEKGLEFFL